MANKKIAIIGGGFAGVFSIVMMKEEGLDPVCFEKTDKPGGTWCYREKSTIGEPSIMPTTIINHSKELGSFSNFPFKKDCSNYMKHFELYNHFLDYANKNDALKHIQYNSEVVEVKRSSNYDETGSWEVTVKNTVTGDIFSDIYDAVLVCVGHFNRPNHALYPNEENFMGEIIHTHSLKGVEKYRDKNVVVVGMGCSGLDAAVEISNVAKHVYLSTRSGAHVLNRVGPRGYPLDYVLLRRYILILLDIFPIDFLSWIMENFVLDQQFNSRLYTVKPKHHVFSKDPVFNDHLASKLLSGLIIQKPDISEFTDEGVLFDGDSSATEIDAVIMATGYSWKFPFLEKGVVEENEDKINLYKCMWPPHLKHSTLAFIGFLLPFGPGFPLGEMQCRWAAHVFSGKGTLPSMKKMMKDIKKRHTTNTKRYGSRPKQTIRVDYIPYLDEIAKKIGAKPNFAKLLFTDPKLYYKLVFGPSVPYQYRLQGPHPWDGAREAIMKCDERVLYPLKRKDVKKVESSSVVLLKKSLFWWLPFA